MIGLATSAERDTPIKCTAPAGFRSPSAHVNYRRKLSNIAALHKSACGPEPDIGWSRNYPYQIPLTICELPAGARMMSKLCAGFLVIASLFAMTALGMLILVVITDVGHLAAPTNSPGMNR